MVSTVEQDEIMARLDALIRETVPDVQTVTKYGGTLYTLRPQEKEGQFCGVFAHKAHVQISFSAGAGLPDPDKRLQGQGKHRRHMRIASASEVSSEIRREGLVKLLRAAVAAQG